jgi:hypothetical protein
MFHLTEAGRVVASDEEITPDDPGDCLRRLIVEIPELTLLGKSYAKLIGHMKTLEEAYTWQGVCRPSSNWKNTM